MLPAEEELRVARGHDHGLAQQRHRKLGAAVGAERLAQRGVTIPCSRTMTCNVRSVGRNLVSDHALLDIVFIRQAEVLLGRDVAQHGRAEAGDVGRTDGRGDVVVSGCDVGGERAECVERSFAAPLDLLFHVFADHVHGHVTWP